MGLDLDQAVIIALGGNLAGRYGSCLDLLEAALRRFACAGLKVTARSSWWRSNAWPDSSLPDFLNGVAIVESKLPPRSLMGFLLGLEGAFGRRRGDASVSRTLDLDLICFGRLRLTAPGLTIPHPRAGERRFVMAPVAEIAPAWLHPVSGATARELAASATIGVDARPLGAG